MTDTSLPSGRHPPDYTSRVPFEFASEHLLLPIEHTAGEKVDALTCLAAAAEHTSAVDNLSLHLDMPIELQTAPPSLVRQRINNAYQQRLAESDVLRETTQTPGSSSKDAAPPDVAGELRKFSDRDLLASGDKAPVARLAAALARAGVLVTAVACAWGWGTLSAGPRRPSLVPLPPATAVAAAAGAVGGLAAFAGRPLREPVSKVVVAAAPPPPKVIKFPKLEVVGTLVNPGQPARAYVRPRGGAQPGKLLTVAVGGQIEGARVKEISPGAVVLEVDGREAVISVGRK